MPQPKEDLYIGLMSGTSLDSIDAAIVVINNNQCQLLHAIEHKIPSALREQLISLCQPGNNEIEVMGIADKQLGREFAKATLTLIDSSEFNRDHITAIGSHGQTIRHRPGLAENSFTVQIGDPNVISYETQITTVADFRRRDMAAGGQGAPLAPAFHRAAFASDTTNRTIVNIGGIANVTLLTQHNCELGFDTGPGNVLMDSWIQKHKQQHYDRNGSWAASGAVQAELLKQLSQHPYFNLQAPKSTGREVFNLSWLEDQLTGYDYAANDVQATLLELTATTIADAINQLPNIVNEVYICGGGAYNTQLMLRLESLLHPRIVANTNLLGIAAEWVEAAAFAWLAKQAMEQRPINTTAITGATSEVILGAIYPA